MFCQEEAAKWKHPSRVDKYFAWCRVGGLTCMIIRDGWMALEKLKRLRMRLVLEQIIRKRKMM